MNLRQSMSGLHTWSGLLVSWLLFVIVFAGSLASFDKELTRWMQPDLHLPGAQSLGADQVRDWLRQRAPDAHAWWMLPPSERAPYWNAGWEPRDGSEFKVFQLDAVSGQPLPKTVGGEFFFTLHYDLHAGMVGLYIVGIAGMLMLVALVSGTIVHRRIFKDFFTLRPQAARQRAWLDAHNVLGVIGLPFHLMIAYTGLVIFIVYYMQAGLQVVYQNDGERFFHEVQGSYEREEVGRPAGPPASIDGLIVEAGKVWGDGGAPGWISVHHPYDEAATVDIRRRDASRILDDQRTVNFDASSGELLHAQPSYAPGYATYGWLTGLHMIQWGGQLVRWMYLLLGLSGAMMIFGGLQVWLAKREVRGSRGVGLVRALNLAVCGGLPLASLALLWGRNTEMKVVRRYPLALLLGMAGALADELPDGSLLQRYGVQADQLPTLAADPPSRKEEKETPSRFRVEPEQPLVTFGVKDHKGMEPTGNPSIDAMHERDRRICRNIRRQALEKGKAQPFDGYIECP